MGMHISPVTPFLVFHWLNATFPPPWVVPKKCLAPRRSPGSYLKTHDSFDLTTDGFWENKLRDLPELWEATLGIQFLGSWIYYIYNMYIYIYIPLNQRQSYCWGGSIVLRHSHISGWFGSYFINTNRNIKKFVGGRSALPSHPHGLTSTDPTNTWCKLLQGSSNCNIEDILNFDYTMTLFACAKSMWNYHANKCV